MIRTWKLLRHGRRHEKITERHKYIHGVVERQHECAECGEKFYHVPDWQEHHYREHAPSVV